MCRAAQTSTAKAETRPLRLTPTHVVNYRALVVIFESSGVDSSSNEILEYVFLTP
jgi:hypothetical protein